MTVALLILASFLATGVAASYFDRRAWNKGYCPSCCRRWRSFDTDSQGGRGYKCDLCQRGIWISWPGIDKEHDRG